jgi:CO/xanthine dehydrogenase FAD-binding subunit
MRPFAFERPTSLGDALALLARGADDGDGAAGGSGAARPLAGGTDLIIRIRDGSIRPTTVVDVKGIREFSRDIRADDGWLRIGARTTMTDLLRDAHIRRDYAALAEAAAYVGSVQIRNRATLAGNICNASPAADTVPALLVYGARIVAVGPGGRRTIPLDDVFVRSGVTTLLPGELVEAIELPLPEGRRGSAHVRRTRRRGHDLASVTLACSVGTDGMTRLSYGSVGPRPLLVVDETGVLADPTASVDAKTARLDELFVDAAPSPTSMRASPEYRLAMLRVLGLRVVTTSIERLRA